MNSANSKNSVYDAEVIHRPLTSTHRCPHGVGAQGNNPVAPGGKQALTGLPGSPGGRHRESRPTAHDREAGGKENIPNARLTVPAMPP